MNETIDNNALLGDLFGGSEEEILKADKSGGNFSKIEKSCIVLAKITMAKQIDSASSASKDFSIEMETEDGAKLYWKAGWYIGKDGTIKDSKGNLKFQAIGLAKINALLTGVEALPTLESAVIKETEWVDGADGKKKPTEVTVTRQVCRAMIGKYVQVKVIRIRGNRQIPDPSGAMENGYPKYIDGPEEKFTNDVQAFYDASTSQSPGEKKLGKPASLIEEDRAYCEKHPILDKYKEVSAVAPQGSATSQPAASGFGQPASTQPAPAQSFAPPAGFGQPQ